MIGSRNTFIFACGFLVFAALIANAAVKFYNLRGLMDNDRWVTHSHQVKERLSTLMVGCVDSESSVRGYVVANRQEFLQPHFAAESRIGSEFQALADLVQDNPQQQSALAEVRQLRDRHLAFLNQVLAAGRDSGAEAARDVVKTAHGRALMDQIRLRIATMLETEERLLVERAQIAKDRYREAIIAGAVGTTLSLLMTGIALVVVWQELRRRRAAEVALKAQVEETRLSAEHFRLLTETVPIHIWIADPSGAAKFLNNSWRAYTGLAADDEGIANWMSAIHPEDVDRLQEICSRGDGGSQDVYQIEVRVRRGADLAYRWHRSAIVPVRTRRGVLQSWVGTLADVQDQKDQAEWLEQAVRLRTQELRRAIDSLNEEVVERMRAEERVGAVAAELKRSNEELEKFAYVASHDLQEPLRKIQAFGDRLSRKYRDQLDDQGRDYIERMLASATRMRTLIDDLLAFSRVASTSRPYDSVDLNVMLNEVLADLEASLAQVQGQVEAKPLPTIKADALQIRQLFQNLIGNALKFAKPGVPPKVSIEATPLAALAEGAETPAAPFPGWRLSFADQGIGFDQVHERRIFEVFQRLHGRDQYTGTGIGLAICRKIVERHGGLLHARGQVDVGATFYVDLPESPS